MDTTEYEEERVAEPGDESWQPPQSEYAVYLTPSDGHRRLGLAVLGAGWHTIAEGGMRWDTRVLNCYALHVVTRGSGWIEWGDRPRTRLPVTAPAAFWLFPGVAHSYRPDAGGWTIMWVLFDGPSVTGYEGLGFLDRTSPVVPLMDMRPVGDLFRELLTMLRTAGSHYELNAGIQVRRMIPAVRASGPGLQLSRAVRELDERATEPVNLQEHAQRLGITVPQLREEVRLVTGSTPKEYIMRVRLSKAKDLLAATDQPIAQIARAVGYDDSAYFARLFTRRVGQTPTGFRRSSTSG